MKITPANAHKHFYYARLYAMQGVRMVWRSRFASLTLVTVLSLLLFVVYIFVAMSAHATQAAKNVDNNLVITVLIKQDTRYNPLVKQEALQATVKKINGVRDITFVSKAQTRQRFLHNVSGLKTQPATYIFQEALEVSVDNVRHMPAIRDQIAKLYGVDQANYLADIAEKLTAVSSYIRSVALGGAILLTIIAALVVIAVVRNAIHAEAKSVATMASVGGSAWTIAIPLVVYLCIIVAIATTFACIAGWWIDPQLGGALGKNISNLPAWLQTGRAFAPGELWLPLAAVATFATSSIAVWSTFRYSRSQ